MIKKRPFLYEIPLFYLLMVGINRMLLPESQGFLGVDPHPYWLGILLFGFRYGVAAGVGAGLVSALLYTGTGWLYAERYLFEDVSFYLLPGFFVLGGALIGAGMETSQRRVERLKKEAEELLRDAGALREEVKVLSEVNRGLEKRIVTRMTTLVTLYEGARRLESFDLEELLSGTLEFVTRALEADEAALYVKDGSNWKLKQSLGWKDYHQRPAVLKAQEGIVPMAGDRNQILSVRDFLGDLKADGAKEWPKLLGDCLMAGPLRRGEGGEPIAVLAIQNMPFLNFNSASISLFAFLLGWASRSVGRAAYVGELKAKEVIDPEYQIYTCSYFLSRGEQEFLRSKTYYLPLSLGLVACDDGDDEKKDGKDRERFLTTVAQLLKESLRDMDVLAHFGQDGYPFGFLLLTANEHQASEAKERILEGAKKIGLKGRVKVGLSSFRPQTKGFETMLQEAKKDAA